MAIVAKKRSSLVTGVIPTCVFLIFFFGTPVVLYNLVESAGGGTIALGLLIGFVLGMIVAVITYNKVFALSNLMEEKIFFRGSMIVIQSGNREKVIDLSKEHISTIDAGYSPTGLQLVGIEIRVSKESFRIAGMNYDRERAIQKFPDEKYIGDFPIAPYEGMSATEVDATNPEAASFIDELLSNLWNYRDLDAGYRYHKSLPWNEEISPKFSTIKIIQGEASYQENMALIEQIKNSALYSVEDIDYLFINRDYLMICPSKKVDVKLKTRIVPFGAFPLRFRKTLGGARGSDHWEYIEIEGVDERGNPHIEHVRFSIYYMDDYYKAEIMKRYLMKRNLVTE